MDDPGHQLFGADISAGISRFHLTRDLTNVRHDLPMIQTYETLLEEGLRQYGRAKSSNDLSLGLKDSPSIAETVGLHRGEYSVLRVQVDHSVSTVFLVPRKYGAFIEVGGGADVLDAVDNFADAKKAWLEEGATDLAQLRVLHTDFQSLEENATLASHGKLFFSNPDLATETAFGTIMLLPVFLLIDWIATLTVLPRRIRRMAVA